DRPAGVEVVDAVDQGGPDFQLAVRRAAVRGGRGADDAGGAEAEDRLVGAAGDRLDVTRAIAAFDLDAEVVVELVAETGEAGPIVFLVEAPDIRLAKNRI